MADFNLSHMILSKSKFVRILGDRKFAANLVGDYFGGFLPGRQLTKSNKLGRLGSIFLLGWIKRYHKGEEINRRIFALQNANLTKNKKLKCISLSELPNWRVALLVLLR